MGYLPSTAPLPNNSLTPIPQSVVDRRNAKIGLLGLLTTRARSITDCYAPAVSFIPSSGLNVAAQVAQAQANISADTIASGTDYGTPSAPSSGNLPSSSPAPVVLPLNQISYGIPGGASIPATSSCDRNPRQTMAAAIPQPQMMMPQPAPAILPAPPPTPQQVMAAPGWKNLCWALRNGAVLQGQFAPSDYMALDMACGQKGYVGSCPPPPDVEQYLAQGNLPTIPVSQAMIDAIPQAPDLTGVACPQSYVMAGLSGYAPPWGTYLQGPGAGSIDWLATLRSNPIALLVIAAAGVWGLSQMGKGRR